LLQGSGEYNKAIADFTKCIDIMPDNPCFWSNRGIAYYEKGEYGKALDDLDKSIALDPENWYAVTYRGLAYARIGETGKAIDDFTRSIEGEPESSFAAYQRGLLYFALAEYDKAVADFSTAIEREPDNSDNWQARGAAHYNKHSPEEDKLAIDDFTRAIEINPNSAAAYLSRGSAELSIAREQSSLRKTVIMEKQRDDVDRFLLLKQLEQIGHSEFIPWANGLLQGLRAGRTEIDNLVIDSAEILAEEALDEALEDLNTAVSLAPDSAEAYYVRGLAYELSGDTGKALADYESTCALDPNHHDAREKRAELLEKQE
jgi:tetratricopeptide (TPR) repeat protein